MARTFDLSVNFTISASGITKKPILELAEEVNDKVMYLVMQQLLLPDTPIGTT